MFKNIMFAAAVVTAIFSTSGTSYANAECQVDPVCAAFLLQEIKTLKKQVRQLQGEQAAKKLTFKPGKKRKLTVRRINEPARVKLPANAASESCAILMQAEASAIVFYEGTYKKRGHVIATLSPKWKKVKGGYTATVCVDKTKLAGSETFSACGSVGHYDFNATEAAQFKRQSGRLGPNDVARMWNNG